MADVQEKTSRYVHAKGSPKQVIQTWSVMGEAFDLESRYKVIDYLGAGAYGVVCAAQDSTENNVVAIKKCKKIFQSRTLAKRTLRELRLLRLFEHENVVKIKSVLKPLDSESFSEIYVVFEIMETDLAQIIRSPQTLKDQHVQYFTYQLLLALKYLHAANIVHRDLKPRNLLVNGDCCLKVADFGLARVYNDSNDSKILAMTEYVTTRWYRAPEVLVGWHRYTSAVDMWAVGCIVAELIGRMPLFPGADSMKQLDLLCRFSGKPSDEFIRQSRKASCRQYLNELPVNLKATDVRNLYPGANPQALDLVKRLLDFNPLTRITAQEALQHPYIQPMLLRNPSARVEPVLSFSDSEFLFEGQKASVDDLRMELLREVNSYIPKPVIPMTRSKGALAVSDMDRDGSSNLTSAALSAHDKDLHHGADQDANTGSYMTAKDKHIMVGQNHSSGYISGDSVNGSSCYITNTTTIPATAAMLLVTPSEVPVSRTTNSNTNSNSKIDEQVRGSKRGRLDTPAGQQLQGKDKSGAASSSSLSGDISVVSERMKALSTSTAATAVADRSHIAASGVTVTPAPSDGSNTDAVPQYVRRGAKRATLASERPPVTAGADVVTAAVSGLDDFGDDGNHDNSEWVGGKVSETLKGTSDAVAVAADISTEKASASTIVGSSVVKGELPVRGGRSLYSCIARDIGSDNDNCDEGTGEDRDGVDSSSICSFTNVGTRGARRCRATKRAVISSSLMTQKADVCSTM